MNRARMLIMMMTMLLFGVPAASAQEAIDYEAILPQGYDGGDARYPVVYLLPQDGYTMDDSDIAARLTEAMESGACAPMIIVRPAFEAGADLHVQMRALSETIDREYRTIADKEHRALMGTGTGGYLAYALGLTQMDKRLKPLAQSDLFHYIISIRGDFASDGNPWHAVYGDLYDMIEGMHLSNPGVFDRFYTYLDAPVDDAWTNMTGSTNDIGALFIGFGTGSAAHEYTVRPGAYTDAFLSESVSRVADRLTKRMFPQQEAQAETPAEPIVVDETPVVDGDFQKIELMGEWKFNYVGVDTVLDAAALTKEATAGWPAVQPGRGHWTKGYGNISDENVISGYGPDYFDYFITGSGYYVKTFTLPQGFDSEDLLLSAGYVDDRCEVFLNGVRVGATGMDENGQSTGETTWAVHSLFEVDPALLMRGGENTIVVRCWNDLPYGAGGWYGGPIGLYSRAAYESLYVLGAEERFYEETFASAYAAKAQLTQGTVDNPYLIYLPESYAASDRRYPTVYLLHQFNSDHTSYRVDKVNELLDQGAAQGLFDEMIVVIPNSSENSWWAGDWEKMITEELIPHIDGRYRTIRDARYRLTAGCSMGGQGAMAVALRNPDFFSGAISFFGAFSYGGISNPNVIAATESAEYMDYFSLYFICGNQDSYGFGVPAIELNQHLEKMGVGHRFFIENGGHDGGFYLPNFIDAFSYVRADMHKSDAAVEKLLSGSVAVNGAQAEVRFEALEGIEAYFHSIPTSSYTKNPAPALSVPLTLEVAQEGNLVYVHAMPDVTITGDSRTAAFACNIAEHIDPAKDATLTLKASVFDRMVTLDAAVVTMH